MSSTLPFAVFSQDLQQQWQKQHAVLQAISSGLPAPQRWRHCLGLAAMLDRPDDIAWCGEVALVHNSQMTWVALRDMPPRPAAHGRGLRAVHYLSTAQAALRYGLQSLDFTQNGREGRDLGFAPTGGRTAATANWHALDLQREARLLAVANRLSEAMTSFACGAFDDRRGFRYPAWAEQAALSGQNWGRQHAVPAQSWLPRCYLAFPLAESGKLFDAVTHARTNDTVFDCPNCHRSSSHSALQRFNGRGLTVFENGDFVARCPHCRQRRKWHLDDGRAQSVSEYLAGGFEAAFLASVRRGLPIPAVGPMTYLGPAKESPAGLPWVNHRLRSGLDSRISTIALPDDALILVHPGHNLASGEVWAQALPGKPQLPEGAEGHAVLVKRVGGAPLVSALRRLWFTAQAIRVVEHKHLVLFPAQILDGLAAASRPRAMDLWWDVGPAQSLMDSELMAFCFPPLPLADWSQLDLELPGQLRLNAAIPVARFQMAACSRRRPRPQGHRQLATANR